jgi:SSS family solute:Na+ symporter
MNLNWLDWGIVLLLFILMIGMVFLSKSLLKSVSDFLATGRTGGRYIISMFHGTAALGAITVVGALEQNYAAGFNSRWWEMMTTIILVGMSVTGWVVYRYRQTRAMTMAQFFEIRYSRKFRIFAGFLAFGSGLVNMIIFPSVTARFFIYFCGIPEIGQIGPYSGTFILVAALMVAIPLFFILSGGHIAVMFTDFIQGVFVNIVFVVIVVVLVLQVNWDQIGQAVNDAPVNASLINPFKATEVQDFNIWFFFIGMFGLIYTKLAWQGNSSVSVAAKSAHEAKMADVLTNWRLIPQWGLFLVFVPVVAYTVLHHADFLGIADAVNGSIAGVESEPLQSQLRVPMVLNQLLPIGLKGAFAAIMLAAAITSHNIYIHSFGSIFIQDCVLPIRKKAFAPEQHMKYLRYSILGVGITIFILSIIFQQSEKVFLFMAVSASIFVGGSGAAIIGGLYWKRGTKTAAWSAMITGAIISGFGIIINSLVEDFPINGQWFWLIAMVSAALMFIIVSMIGPKQSHNMDKLLHRGEYKVKGDSSEDRSAKGWKALGPTKEFTRGDKIIYIATYGWTAAWTVVFIIGTIYNLTSDVSNETWLSFWKIYTWIYLVTAVIVTIWFTIGGVKNLGEMIHALRTNIRDHSDSGFVENEDSN